MLRACCEDIQPKEAEAKEMSDTYHSCQCGYDAATFDEKNPDYCKECQTRVIEEHFEYTERSWEDHIEASIGLMDREDL